MVGFLIAIHEWGHFLEMTKRGIYPPTFSVGIPLKFLPTKSFTWKRYPGVTFKINPLLIGGYVAPTWDQREKTEEMPYRDQAAIYGGGIVMNIVVGFLSLGLAALVGSRGFFVAGCLGGIGLLTWFFRGLFTRYLFLLVGIGSAILTAIVMVKDPGGSLSGPIGIVQMAAEKSTSVEDTLVMLGAISIAIALFNILPLGPLDGGRTLDALLITWRVPPGVRGGIAGAGFVIVFLLAMAAIGSDIVHLFR